MRFNIATTQSRDPLASRAIKEQAMVKRTSLEHADCPIARALDAIGDWWSLLIIRDALLGRRRFGEFQKRLGLAKSILAVRPNGRPRQPVEAARLRRQGLSGICADAEMPRVVSGSVCWDSR